METLMAGLAYAYTRVLFDAAQTGSIIGQDGGEAWRH